MRLRHDYEQASQRLLAIRAKLDSATSAAEADADATLLSASSSLVSPHLSTDLRVHVTVPSAFLPQTTFPSANENKDCATSSSSASSSDSSASASASASATRAAPTDPGFLPRAAKKARVFSVARPRPDGHLLSQLCVVLVRTEGGVNLGQICRTAANLGVTDVRLVAPECAPLSADARRFAHHALPLLAHLPTYASLSAAVRDCELIVGTSGKDCAGQLRGVAWLAPHEVPAACHKAGVWTGAVPAAAGDSGSNSGAGSAKDKNTVIGSRKSAAAFNGAAALAAANNASNSSGANADQLAMTTGNVNNIANVNDYSDCDDNDSDCDSDTDNDEDSDGHDDDAKETAAKRRGTGADAACRGLDVVAMIEQALARGVPTLRSRPRRRYRSQGPRVALVFGNEADGMTLAELRQCSHMVTIPMRGAYPSMNLAHAVTACLFAIEHAGWPAAIAAAAGAATNAAAAPTGMNTTTQVSVRDGSEDVCLPLPAAAAATVASSAGSGSGAGNGAPHTGSATAALRTVAVGGGHARSGAVARAAPRSLLERLRTTLEATLHRLEAGMAVTKPAQLHAITQRLLRTAAASSSNGSSDSGSGSGSGSCAANESATATACSAKGGFSEADAGFCLGALLTLNQRLDALANKNSGAAVPPLELERFQALALAADVGAELRAKPTRSTDAFK